MVELFRRGSGLVAGTTLSVYFEGDNYSRIDPGDLTNSPTIYNQSNTWTGANAFSAVSTPSVDTASATTLTLGGTNTNQITIGNAAGTPATIRGALTVTGLTTNTGGIATTSVDTATATTLTLGGTNANQITIGKAAGTPATINGALTVTGLTTNTGGIATTSVDTASATTLTLGGTNANQITIGKAAGTPATIRGNLTVTGSATTGGVATTVVDTASAVPLNIGTANTSLLNLGKVGTLVDIMGDLSIDGNLTKPITPSYTYDSLTGTGVSGTIGHMIRGAYGTTTGMTSGTNHTIASLTIDDIGVWSVTGVVGFRAVTTASTLNSFRTEIRQVSTVFALNSYSNNTTGTTPINSNFFVSVTGYVVNTTASTVYNLIGQVNSNGTWNTNATNFYFYAIRIA
jgi:hypothetical protein